MRIEGILGAHSPHCKGPWEHMGTMTELWRGRNELDRQEFYGVFSSRIFLGGFTKSN